MLLDTHCWLWLQFEPERLSPPALALARHEDTELVLSAVSSWEIAIKWALGKVTLPEPPHHYVPGRMRRDGIVGLPIEHADALAVDELPRHHRDPFDRLLIAQSCRHDLPLLTADPAFSAYDVRLVDARSRARGQVAPEA